MKPIRCNVRNIEYTYASKLENHLKVINKKIYNFREVMNSNNFIIIVLCGLIDCSKEQIYT